MPNKQKLFKLDQGSSAPAPRKVMRNGYKFVDHHDRVSIIYDNLIHDLQPMVISKARNIHYNTVRHILHRFYEDGHLKIKKSINNGSMVQQALEKSGDLKDSQSQKESDTTQPDSNLSDSEHVPVAPKQKRRYRKKIVKAKVAQQKTDGDEEAMRNRDFIIPGPLTLDLQQNYQTACPIALYVAVDDKSYETVGQESMGLCGGQTMYPFDIPKLNQAEYQDERGEIGDKYQISDTLKSIKNQMNQMQSDVMELDKASERKCKQILQSQVQSLQNFLVSGLNVPNCLISPEEIRTEQRADQY